MERKLRYIEGEVRKDNVTIPDVLEFPKAPNPREIIDLEVRFFENIYVFFYGAVRSNDHPFH